MIGDGQMPEEKFHSCKELEICLGEGIVMDIIL